VSARVVPRFANADAAELWLRAQPCRGGDCEAEVVGDPPIWRALPCRRHGDWIEISERLYSLQQCVRGPR
jgi:hypothetical protein